MIADLKILAEYPSPSLLFFVDEIKHNIDTCLSWVGNQPERLRMHVKTHKCPEVVKIQLAKGLTKHKAATIAEAQMLAMCGAPDVFIAYPMVGPNLKRLANLIRKYEGTTFSVSVDHPEAGEMLGNTMTREGLTLEVLLDFDMGFKRTGFPVEAAALDLYRTLASTKGIKATGFHTYDGHNQLEHHGDRLAELDRVWSQIMEMRATLEKSGIAVPKIISGGTPTFILYSKLNVPGLECSPGTLTLHDFGYGNRYTELKTFKYGAGLLTRVISKQGANGITVDLGYKAVSG
ncbi:MAG: alanine racemase, partial [Gemmataceae bacterium]|nr:alanine racemase [Gemmataceae bacterium]